MNDLDLETRIRAAAPQVSIPLGLAEHSTRILQEARARRGRRLRKWAMGVAASVAIVGGGTIAVAGNDLHTPWGWTADNVHQFPGPNGQTCFTGIQVKPDGVADDAPVVIAAREILAGIDLDALDTSEWTAWLETEEDRRNGVGRPGVVHHTPEEIAMKLTPEEIAQDAMIRTAADLLYAELRDRGLTSDDEPSVMLFSMAQGCR
ncbi:hypothetical protein V1639_02840 [Pseudarthrobacter sp. J75]|uniref:hypothetical protein n=1 Tax=unclassified Pseudarthrobacter TaxID=2647000 RepID=UPI002E7FBF12|nr:MULTISPECIES: hypothetical protein [unclassified Pseudarthrobacter]MEE2522390.1 hypothetical protein [Pseudarthrobacter sp. J47]MEE2527964.1 hypothetical protein [Pseudarthrobacter sp. J75]